MSRKFFQSILFTLLVNVILVCANTVAAKVANGSANTQTSVEQLSGEIGTLASMRADFKHKLFDSKGLLLQESKGTFTLQQPNNFYWKATSPVYDLIVADGINVWHYDEELNQVTVQDITAEQQFFPIDLFLSGEQSKISKRFVVKTLAKKECANLAKKCFELKTKTENEEKTLAKILLGFNSGGICYLKLWDQLGQKSEFKFNNVEKNPKLNASLFKFNIPAGADLLGQPK